MSLRSVAVRLLQDALKGNDAEKFLVKLDGIDTLIAHVPKNSIQSGFSQLDRNVRLAMLDGLHDVIKLAKTPEIKAAVARDYVETFRKNFPEGAAGQQAFGKFQTEFATEFDNRLKPTSVEIARPKNPASTPTKGKPDDPNIVDAEIVPSGSKKPSFTIKAKPIEVKPVVLNFIDEMTNHTLRGKDSSAIKSAFKDLRALLSENHPELLVTKLETPRENTLKPAAIIKNIRDGRPVTRDELNKAETLYITRAENKVAADVAAARKAEAEAEAARKAEADAAARKAEAEAEAARKAEAYATAARKAEEDRVLAEKQAGARAAMIGDINSILTENVPNSEQLKDKFAEMRRVLGEQGLLDSSPRFTPSNMNPDDLARALAEGRPIHVDDISNVERRLLNDIDQVAKEASRENSAKAERIAVKELQNKQQKFVEELEGALVAPRSGAMDTLSRLWRGRQQYPTSPPAQSENLITKGGRSIHQILNDLRDLRLTDGYNSIPLVEDNKSLFHKFTGKTSPLSPRDVMNALHQGQSVSPESFRNFSEALSSGGLDTRHFITRRPKAAVASVALLAYAAGGVYDFYGDTPNSPLKSAPIIAQVPPTLMTEWADKAKLNSDGTPMPGFEDYSPQVDWEIKKGEKDQGYRAKLVTFAYTQMSPERQKEIYPQVATLLLASKEPGFFAGASDYQRVAGNAFIQRVISANNQISQTTNETSAKAVGSLLEKTQADSKTAPAPVLKGLFTRSADSTEAAKNIPETIDKMAEEFDINNQEASELKKAWQSAAKKTDSSEAFREQAQKILSESSLHRAPENVHQLVQRLGM